MSRISIKKAEGEDIFASLDEKWRRLFKNTENSSSPFLAWEWLSTWYKWFGGGKTPYILEIYRENCLIGLMPLCLTEKKVLGMSLKRLGFIGEAQGGADYLDLIAKPEDKREILPAVFDFLKKDNCFEVICLENLSEKSATADFLRNLEKRSFRGIEETTAICPQIDLKGGWESVLKQSRRASNFKRRLKRLEKMPDFEFRSVTSPPETGAAFERFFRLHEQRWREKGGSELSGHPRLVSFQRDLAARLASSGLLRFEELWAKGECRASVYGLDDGKTFYYYNAGYDLQWSDLSVGLVLIGLSVKNAIERGNTIYDFLRGDETYKFDWANQKTNLIAVTLSRKTLSALAYEKINRTSGALRRLSKSVLPSDWTEKIKIWRRAWKRSRQLPDLAVEKIQKVYER